MMKYINQKIVRQYYRIISKIKEYSYIVLTVVLYIVACGIKRELPVSLYNNELRKYVRYIKTASRKDQVYTQIKSFFLSSFDLKSDKLIISENPLNPILVVVVRNELKRMKVFFQHYHKLGVEQFVVLDNSSEDGTLEYCMSQDGTRVFQILDDFQTHKKEAWIEKLLVLVGADHWYIVVDSDELLDYVGSEEHSVKELIQKSAIMGYKRIWGYMLDMYTKSSLFSEIHSEELITNKYRYFDYTTYRRLSEEKNSTGYFDEIYGGPRYRIFNTKCMLNKQAIFFYDKDTLYRNCHSLYPLMSWTEIPCWFVLKHYKFLSEDKAEYIRRIKQKSFYNNSIEYRTIMQQFNKKEDVSLFYEGSKEYVNSCSLNCLPYLQKFEW